MSTELTTVRSEHSNAVDMTQHSGGADRGRVVSMTQRSHHTNQWNSVELDREQAVRMVAALTEWLANGADNFTGHDH
jgi:hypothetical protein